MNEKITFIPRIQKEYGADNILVVKEALGGHPIRMWVHDWKPQNGWKVDPDIPRTHPPKKKEILYKSMIGKNCRDS